MKRHFYRDGVIDDVEVKDAGPMGRGVFARRDFTEGEFIFRRRHTRGGRSTQAKRSPSTTGSTRSTATVGRAAAER